MATHGRSHGRGGRRAGSESFGSCLGDEVILFARAAADANGSHDSAASLEWDPPGEDHDPAVVGGVYAEGLTAGLGVLGQIAGGDVKGARSERLLDRDIDAPEPRTVHPHVRVEVAPFIAHRDVHRLPELSSLLPRCGYEPPRSLRL